MTVLDFTLSLPPAKSIHTPVRLPLGRNTRHEPHVTHHPLHPPPNLAYAAYGSAWLLVNWLTMVILGWVWVWLGPYLGLVMAYNQTQNNYGYFGYFGYEAQQSRENFFR